MQSLRLLLVFIGLVAWNGAVAIDFPTPNRALIVGENESFYMYVHRSFQGRKSSPWEGGQYGYVRSPQMINGKVVYTKFHEGIDIKPVRRDAEGEPLDPVVSVDDGRVVLVSDASGHSNYGRYVVVEHIWGGCPYYTLYAHLNSCAVNAGESVSRGHILGRLGYTGAGIDRPRAHLHFEICLLASADFETWHGRHMKGSGVNRHGNFNGLNLLGFDPAKFLLANRGDRHDVPGFFSNMKPAYQAQVPSQGGYPGILERYPWLASKKAKDVPSWLVTVSAHGLPLRFEPSSERVAYPTIVKVAPTGLPYEHVTKGHVAGVPGARATLTGSGRAYLELICMP